MGNASRGGEFVVDPGQVVVVTGASGGVGRATARALGARGARVALLARGTLGLQAACEEVRAAGAEALPVAVDVADPDQVEAAAAQVEAAFGPIEVWVNAAFTSVFSPFHQIEAAEYRRVTEVTYLGFVFATMAALGRMRSRGRGTIVQVGSALAYRGIPLQSAYCGAKHAIQGFTESLRCELLHEDTGVNVTMVQLPGLNTPQFSWVRSKLPRHPRPVPPIYQPEIAAKAILYAIDHPHRREYWVGGSTAATLLANAVVPGLLDRYLARTGIDSQQTAEPGRDRTSNLWEPADGTSGRDYGAHGVFDGWAKDTSLQLWASQHRRALAVAGSALAALTGLAVSGRVRSEGPKVAGVRS